MNQQDGVVDKVNSIIKVPNTSVTNSSVQGIMSTVLLAAAGLAIIFIAVGGLRYVLSQGDPQGTQQAKEAIVYAIIGLVITISAFAIVNFVYGVIL